MLSGLLRETRNREQESLQELLRQRHGEGQRSDYWEREDHERRDYATGATRERTPPPRPGKRPWAETDDPLRSFPITLPKLCEPMEANAALEAGDWLTKLQPLVADVSSAAGDWWREVQRVTMAKYEQWLVAGPLQKLKIEPPNAEKMPQGYDRLERRLTNMLMLAIPESLQADLVASRELRPQAILFKVLKTFQPGGLNERSETLAALTASKEASTAVEAVQRLRLWKRQWTRSRELGASAPDPVLLVGALDTIMKGLLAKDSQATFRVSTYRMANEVDIRPTPTTVMQYHELLQSEADLMVAGTVTSGGISKGAPGDSNPGIKAMTGISPPPIMPGKAEGAQGTGVCKWWGTEEGCRKGKLCRFQHGPLADQGARCWICSSKNHRKSECPHKGGNVENQPRYAAGGSGKGGMKEGGKESGKKPEKRKGSGR